jgi:hypothetical protein
MDVLSYVCCLHFAFFRIPLSNYIFVQYEKDHFVFFDVALGVLLLTIFLTIKYLKLNYNQQQELSNKKTKVIAN